MQFTPLPLKNAYIINPEPHQDRRGLFARIFCSHEFHQIRHKKEIVQVNHSLTTKKGAVRGLHFQYPPRAETKIVKCIQGTVFDVIVDLRKNSSTYLQWHGEILSPEKMNMMYVPEGFAHGFQALEGASEIIYLVTEFYAPELEGGLRYNDPALSIQWPMEVTEVSDKDRSYGLLNDCFLSIDL